MHPSPVHNLQHMRPSFGMPVDSFTSLMAKTFESNKRRD
jgi:hypothetical protein